MKILRREMRDVDIDPVRDLMTYDQPGIFDLYAASAIVRPDKRQHFPLLLNSWFDYWCEQAPTRRIGKMYARILSDTGELMVKKLFFSPMYNISEDAWMLDVSRPNPSRIVRSFQACMRDA